MSTESLRPIRIDTAVLPGLEAQKAQLPPQDVVAVSRVGRFIIAGVYDGHGPAGLAYATRTSSGVSAIAEEHQKIIGGHVEQLDMLLQNLSDDPALQGKDGGTSATIAVIEEDKAALLQLGDSGAVFYPATAVTRAERLTPVHNATNPDEVRRVRTQGGHLSPRGYFSDAADKPGMLASRGIGDPGYDFVSHEPEITEYTVTEPGTLLIATDGLWGTHPTDIAEQLEWHRNTDPSTLPPERRHRTAAYLAQVGVASSKDDTGIIAVEFGIVRA